MKKVKVLDKEFQLSIPVSDIQKRVKELADEISEDYKGKDPLFVGILNGSFIFAADLFRNLSIDAEISFIKVSSYEGTGSTGNIESIIGLKHELRGRDVIIVEDIIDTGATIESVVKQFKASSPESVSVITLLFKPAVALTNIKIDYAGFSINEDFVIGYGLDYNGFGRKYRDIYSLIKE